MMADRMFAGKGKNIFAIVMTFFLFFEMTLNIEWESLALDMMAVVRMVSKLRELWIPILLLVVLFTARKKYWLKGTLFSIPFLYLAYDFGKFFYSLFFSKKYFEHHLQYYIKTPSFWCYAVITLGMLLIFIGAVWKFKLWPLIAAGGFISSAASAVLFWVWFKWYRKVPLMLILNPLDEIERVNAIFFLVYAVFFLAIALLPLNKKPKLHTAEVPSLSVAGFEPAAPANRNFS